MVTIFNNSYPDGFAIDEPYIDTANAAESEITMKLGSDEYFVLGDNRKASADSRYWGPLESDRIIGRAYVRLFPFNLIGILPGVAHYDELINQ